MNGPMEYESDYAICLTMAGATVHKHVLFGSYQGEWIADVTLPDGTRGFIVDSYGSCSGCDAFEAELGYDAHRYAHDGDKFTDGCAECAERKAKMAAFGKRYFAQIKTPQQLVDDIVNDEPYNYFGHDERERAEWLAGYLTDASLVAALRDKLIREATK